jgi:hypothetical protein
VWVRCGAPDVITKERTDHDKAPFIVDYTRKTSFDSASDDSSVYSENAEQLSFIDEEIEEEAQGATAKDCDSDSESDDDDPISQIISQKSPTRLTIKLHVTDKISSSWDSVSLTCTLSFISINNNFLILRSWIMTTTSCMSLCPRH